MSVFGMSVELIAYIICIGIALDYSYKFFWRIRSKITSLNCPNYINTIVGALLSFTPLAIACIVTLLFNCVFNQFTLDGMGFRIDSRWAYDLASGTGIALASVSIIFLIGMLFGLIKIKRPEPANDRISTSTFINGLTDFFIASVFEEIVFRGFIFFLLEKAIGWMGAIIVSASIFTFAHIIHHTKTPHIFVANIFVFGIIAGTCRHITGTLWLPIGLHFGWNIISGPILGIPFAGKTYDRGVVVSEVLGPNWLTGGLYSLDAGILGTFALAVAAVALTAVFPLN